MEVIKSLPHENLKCSKHPNKCIIFIQVNQLDDNKNIFYCQKCILENEIINPPDFVEIDQIIEFCNTYNIKNWPPIDDKLLKDQIKKLQIQNKKQNSLELQINKYFDTLKTKIMQKIDSCQKDMINKALKSPYYEDLILSFLLETQKTDQFQSILLNCNTQIDIKEQQCRDFINQINKDKSNYTEQLNQIFDKRNKNEQKFDFETPKQIKKSILKLIENINFFIEEDNLKNEQANINLQIIQNMKVEQLIKLMSVKTNFLSNEFIDSIKRILNQISPLIDQVDFNKMHSQMNNNSIDFSQLCDRQLKIISDLATYYAQDQNIITELIKEEENFLQISSILNNKTNYLEKDFIDDFEQYIIDTYPLLNSIKSFKDNKQIETFINLENEDLQDIHELIQKKKYLDDRKQQKSQSLRVSQILFQSHPFNKQALDTLLQKYPIYDLLDPITNIDLLPDMLLIKSNLNQQYTQKCEMKLLENNQIQISSKIENYGNYYSKLILDRNEKYVFRFQFKRKEKSGESFSIGLVSDVIKDADFSYFNNLSCQFKYDHNNSGYLAGHGIDSKVKGDLRNTRDINCIELRVCINDGILEVVDYPSYNHKYSIPDDKRKFLTESENLRLAIFILHEIEVTLISANICEQFDN